MSKTLTACGRPEPLFVDKHHRVDDPDGDTKAGQQRHPGERPDSPDDNRRIGLDKPMFKRSAPDEFFVFGRFVKPELLNRHPTCKNDCVHREFFGSEVRVEEVDSKNKARREQCFIAVNNGRPRVSTISRACCFIKS